MTSGPWAPTPEGVPCDFVDGRTAERHTVYVQFDTAEDRLSLRCRGDGPEGNPRNWPLPHLRRVEGQSRLERRRQRFGVLTNVLTPEARLYVEDPALLSRIEAAAPDLGRRAPVSGRGRLAALMAGAVASVGLIVLVLIPAIAGQLAALLPVEGERALGDRTYDQIRAAFSEDVLPIRECTAPPGLAALDRMERKLIAASTLSPDAVTLTVLDLDMVNAFALPGGRIVVMRGLIDAAEAPEEVAAVIAHEMGHVAHRDPTRHALRAVGTFGVLSLVFGDFAGGTLVLMTANQLVNARYSQEAESAADAYAHEILPRAEISPGALAPLFERLQAEQGEAGSLSSHLASHPQLGDRVARARAAAEGYTGPGVPVLVPADWQRLRGICE
ncbi:M48 family metallopeptidase [Celeribacter indicus]|uniref:Uncharacterized protein n=1 Tax=Celeribacter indicus TaxID=1208324 RepID=A0A0B5DYQ4_9RHOB|nr:M48 family metallopeptidase [Celeribacter indicus]AJE45347.1 hypothetical protein P73_0632 [Celeribacter indicus]SDW99535.1 Peptidase family M48 [Celeribacter indicus]